MREIIENIIKKNLPEEKFFKEEFKCGGCNTCEACFIANDDETRSFNEALSQINTSLIADEVIKKFIDYLELNPNEDGSTSPNIPHWIEKKQSQLRKLLSIVSPNKENE